MSPKVPSANGSIWKLMATALMAGAIASVGVFLTVAAGRPTRTEMASAIDQSAKHSHAGSVTHREIDRVNQRLGVLERNVMWIAMQLGGPRIDWTPTMPPAPELPPG